MKIKEVEQLVGITSANIRYYESQGLISPERSENGYRDYAESDVQILWRVKLLRLLGISIDEIKALQTGEHNLLSSLDSRLAELEGEQIALEQAQYICRTMRDDGAEYATLDAQRYLEALARQESDKNNLANDTIPRAVVPWRRYFARFLDISVYSQLFQIFLVLGFRVNLTGLSTGWDILGLVVAIALTVAIEPVLLSRFGTTLGKWIMGLRVVGDDGNKLTYDQAMCRLKDVIVDGEGLYIPIYNWYRNYKCYWMVAEGKALPWEDDNYIVASEWKLWRVAPLVGVYGLMVVLLTVSMMYAERPINRGDLTIAEFSENYNVMSKYLGSDEYYYLNEFGQYVETPRDSGAVYVGDRPRSFLPHIEYDLDGENIIRIRIYVQPERSAEFVSGESWLLSVSTLCYAGAQGDGLRYPSELQELIATLDEDSTCAIDTEVCGVEIKRDVEMEGYQRFGNWLHIEDVDDYDAQYIANYTMTKITE